MKHMFKDVTQFRLDKIKQPKFCYFKKQMFFFLIEWDVFYIIRWYVNSHTILHTRSFITDTKMGSYKYINIVNIHISLIWWEAQFHMKVFCYNGWFGHKIDSVMVI